jgi:hypothetical protein
MATLCVVPDATTPLPPVTTTAADMDMPDAGKNGW